MPVCLHCGIGYDGPERACPSCGASPGSAPPRYGWIAIGSLRIAWAAAFVASIVVFIGGVVAIIRGEWFIGLLLIFIMAPVGYGQHMALRIAIDYAEGK
jgi:hypothetical protein